MRFGKVVLLLLISCLPKVDLSRMTGKQFESVVGIPRRRKIQILEEAQASRAHFRARLTERRNGANWCERTFATGCRRCWAYSAFQSVALAFSQFQSPLKSKREVGILAGSLHPIHVSIPQPLRPRVQRSHFQPGLWVLLSFKFDFCKSMANTGGTDFWHVLHVRAIVTSLEFTIHTYTRVVRRQLKASSLCIWQCFVKTSACPKMASYLSVSSSFSVSAPRILSIERAAYSVEM